MPSFTSVPFQQRERAQMGAGWASSLGKLGKGLAKALSKGGRKVAGVTRRGAVRAYRATAPVRRNKKVRWLGKNLGKGAVTLALTTGGGYAVDALGNKLLGGAEEIRQRAPAGSARRLAADAGLQLMRDRTTGRFRTGAVQSAARNYYRRRYAANPDTALRDLKRSYASAGARTTARRRRRTTRRSTRRRTVRARAFGTGRKRRKKRKSTKKKRRKRRVRGGTRIMNVKARARARRRKLKQVFDIM